MQVRRIALLIFALWPALSWSEAGEYSGADALDQTLGHAAAARNDTSTAAPAPTITSADVYEGDEVHVTGRAANLLGRADSGSSGSVDQEDLSHRALLRPAEVLEAVPGLLITQHSGDGKANQYFTRGFNLDHGTDFAFSMDGVPVNEQSNAHGQGYTDLNFMIPELVKAVNYSKGPVNVEAGDFNSAGSADFVYPTVLSSSLASLTMGEFGYQRAMAASQLSLLGGNLIFALEIANYDGPWTVPEANRKYNGFLRYSRGPAGNQWVISASVLEASWNATNQVPESAIADGTINQFGAIDPTDGGDRRRDAVWTSWTGKSGDAKAYVMAYVMVSHLQLWNDFTYDLVPAHGAEPAKCEPCDQFEELDDRTREGGTARYKFQVPLGKLRSQNEVGVDFRNDNITGLNLYDTVQRQRWQTVSADQVIETSEAPYVKSTVQWTPWLKGELGFRQDFFDFNVQGTDPSLPSGQNQTLNTSIPEPKAGLSLRPGQGPLEIYLNYDWGFHSNDARSITPFSVNQNHANPPPLAQAKGEELGFRYAQGDRYESTLAFWYLDMASELTFDGDTAQSLINNASYRKGVEWSNTFRAKPFFMDLDLAFSDARFFQLDTQDDPVHPGYLVPEAIAQVGTATFGLDKMDGWSADARVRYFGARNLTADGAEQSSPDTLVSLHLGRDLVGGQTLNLDVFNLLNVSAADVSYYYEYKLAGSPAREDMMTHATEPRSLRVTWVDRF